MDLGEGEAGAAQVESAEVRVVAAGGLGPALQDVPGDDGPGERVEVLGAPAEVGGGGTADEGRVGDASGDDDVGTRVEAGGDPGAAEVGVRGEGARREGQPVAFDVSDAQPASDRAGPRGRAGRRRVPRVEPARVGDDADAPFAGEA